MLLGFGGGPLIVKGSFNCVVVVVVHVEFVISVFMFGGVVVVETFKVIFVIFLDILIIELLVVDDSVEVIIFCVVLLVGVVIFSPKFSVVFTIVEEDFSIKYVGMVDTVILLSSVVFIDGDGVVLFSFKEIMSGKVVIFWENKLGVVKFFVEAVVVSDSVILALFKLEFTGITDMELASVVEVDTVVVLTNEELTFVGILLDTVTFWQTVFSTRIVS